MEKYQVRSAGQAPLVSTHPCSSGLMIYLWEDKGMIKLLQATGYTVIPVK